MNESTTGFPWSVLGMGAALGALLVILFMVLALVFGEDGEQGDAS